MKAFYLTASIIFTVLILILSFGNIGAQCSQLYLLFFPVSANPTIIFLGVAAAGIFTGIFYHAFMEKVLEASKEEENEDF